MFFFVKKTFKTYSFLNPSDLVRYLARMRYCAQKFVCQISLKSSPPLPLSYHGHSLHTQSLASLVKSNYNLISERVKWQMKYYNYLRLFWNDTSIFSDIYLLYENSFLNYYHRVKLLNSVLLHVLKSGDTALLRAGFKFLMTPFSEAKTLEL